MAADTDLRIFFIHLPKSGGTSLRHAIENIFSPSEIYRVPDGPSQYERAIEFANDGARWVISGHVPFCLSERLGVPHISIFISRDPVQRFFSSYWYWRTVAEPTRLTGKTREVVQLSHDLDMPSFIDAIKDDVTLRSVSPIGELYRVLGQLSIDFAEYDMKTAVERLRKASIVVTLPNLSEKLPKILQELGVGCVGHVPVLNRSAPYEVPQILRSRVEMLMAEDIALHDMVTSIESEDGADIECRGSSKCLFHHIDPDRHDKCVIYADGPFFGSGVLPIEEKVMDGVTHRWRRVVVGGCKFSMKACRTCTMSIAVNVVSAIFDSSVDVIGLRVDGVDMSCIFEQFGYGGEIKSGVFRAESKAVMCVEVILGTRNIERENHVTFGFSEIRFREHT